MEDVRCVLSHAGSDVRCAVCGQGFLVHWSRRSRSEQMACRQVIQNHLRAHHVSARDEVADRRIHPRDEFPVPAWAFAVTDETKPAMEEVA